MSKREWRGGAPPLNGPGHRVYCPTCDAELNYAVTRGDAACFDVGGGFYSYDCFRCGTSSRWDFNPPVPLLVHHEDAPARDRRLGGEVGL